MKIMAVPALYFQDHPRDTLVQDASILASVQRLIYSYHDYKERDALETDLTFRQPIPYVLVTNAVGSFVLMQRLKWQGEQRLHGKFYIGAGGHVEEGHSVAYTALKEVTEELGLPLQTLSLRGTLITTGGPVEDVHLCLFYRATTLYNNFTSPEAQVAGWATHDDLAAKVSEMEKWSQIIARDFLNIK